MVQPSIALFCAFCLVLLVSFIIAVYGDWGFTEVESVEGGWIGMVWIWVGFRLLISLSHVAYALHL